jgi:hypothetical protein
MSKRTLGILGLVIMVVGALVPALLVPSQAEAGRSGEWAWMVYTPNHPSGCAPIPYDCYVIWVYPQGP